MLNGAMARIGRDATHPNKHGRIIESQLQKAYHASALSARLACTNSLLLVYLEQGSPTMFHLGATFKKFKQLRATHIIPILKYLK